MTISEPEKAGRVCVVHAVTAVLNERWKVAGKVEFWHEKNCQMLSPGWNSLSAEMMTALCDCKVKLGEAQIDLLPPVKAGN